MPRKRTHAEVEASEPPHDDKKPSLIHKIRNMWEFASFMQYIFMFGKIMKIDEDFDIEDFENECLKPGYSDKLEEIGLQLLRFVSSNRGLNFDNWDEYVRRQFQSKASERQHPYGEEEQPQKFRSFDIFTKIRVLHQLSVWTFWNPDRIRGAMPDAKESEQLDWRMNVFGWDEDDREYYVLDDSRLYRRTEPPLPAAPKAKPKANSKKARAARRRASKRRKLEETDAETETHDEEEEDTQLADVNGDAEQDPSQIDTFGGFKWECVAITLDDYRTFIDSLKTSVKNYPNERAMRDRLNEEVLPIIEELAEKQRRKQERRERDLMMMERMAGAKRSSRLADKHEKERRDQEEAEVARKRSADLAAAHREQERQEKMERERQSRMMTREQRIKDREYKRLLMEEELARDAEEQLKIKEGEKRGSERHIRERIEKNKKELEELEGEEDWTFDCSGCGIHGKNLDDGSHSLACEKCSVWQHSKCLGIAKSAAEKDDFTFVCDDCRRKEREEAQRKKEEAKRREEEANKPKIMLKFHSGQSSSPPQMPARVVAPTGPEFLSSVDISSRNPQSQRPLSSTGVNGYHIMQSPPHSSHHSASSDRPVGSQAYNTGIQQSQHMNWQTRTPQVAHHGDAGVQQSTHAHVAQASQQSINGVQHTQTYQQPNVAFANTSPNSSRANQHEQQQHNTYYSSSGMQSTPRPSSSYDQRATGIRLPSPIVNRPKMSPTQGNPDVGPIAGVPNSSSSSYHPALFSSQPNGTSHAQPNGSSRPNSSSSPSQQLSQTPQPQHLSGLSPVKQRSPLPSATSMSEHKPAGSASPPVPLSFGNSGNNNNNNALFNSAGGSQSVGASFSATPVQATARSVSSTPIFPPAEKLAPSPEHMDRRPVPTPTKQPTPTPTASFEAPAAMKNSTGVPNPEH